MPPPGYEPFLDTILDSPRDDGPRMVYADWLEEQGDPRAEFIRVQLDLSRTPSTDPAWERLSDRESTLMLMHGDAWRAELPEWSRDSCEFTRGFASHVHIWMPWRRFYGPQLSTLAPVERVTLHHAAGALERFAAGPEVQHLTELAILDDRMTPDDLKVLCHSEVALAPLKSLQLMGMDLLDSGALLISLCPHLAGLQRLEMIRCKLGHRAVVVLADTEHLPSLNWIDLSDNELAIDSFWYLINSPRMKAITRLHWNDNGLTDEAARALVDSPSSRGLTHLELAGNHLGDAAARLLIEHFPNLQYLSLARNFFTRGMALRMKEFFGPRVRLGLPGE